MSEPSKTAVFVFVITAHLAILAFAFPRLENLGTGQQASASATAPADEVAKATTPEKPHAQPAPVATAADHQPANAPSGAASPAADKVQHDSDRSREHNDHDHSAHGSQHRLADSDDSDEDREGTTAIAVATDDSAPASAPEPEQVVTTKSKEPAAAREPSPATMPRPKPIAVTDSSKAPAPTLTQAKSTSATSPHTRPVDDASSDPGHSRMKNLRPLSGNGR